MLKTVMKSTMFLVNFGVLVSLLAILTFVHKVQCDVKEIVDLKVEDNEEEFEETSYQHRDTSQDLFEKKMEEKDYNFHDSGHRRLYAGRVYKEMFQKHRLAQHEATKAVLKFGDYEKRYKLVSRMLFKIFETLEEVKMNTTKFDIKPGPLFPDEDIERDSVSKIYENVFLFGDLLLRMPDMVHSIYDRMMQWRYVLGWAKEWCKLSMFFEGPSEVILSAIWQEANVIPKDDEWIPDYSNMTEVELDLVKTYYDTYVRAGDLDKVKKIAIKKEKKEKKKVKKGPRMSKEEL